MLKYGNPKFKAEKLNCTPKIGQKTFWGVFMKYGYRVRLAIVKRVKQGEAISHLSEAYSVSRNKIREWVQMWDKYGCSGLKYQPHSRPTRALKEKIVRLILERGVPLTQVRVEYRICRTTLYCWVNTVRKVWLWWSWTVKTHGTTKEERTTNRAWKATSREFAFAGRERTTKKSEGLSRDKKRPRTSEWARVIDELRSEYPLDLLLELRKMARSVFYYQLNSSHKCNRPSHLRNYDPKFSKSIFLGSQIA